MYPTGLPFVADLTTKIVTMQHLEVLAVVVRAADGLTVRCHPSDLIRRCDWWTIGLNGPTPVPADAKQVDPH